MRDGWRNRELNAARLTGTLVVSDDLTAIARRRAALDEHARLTRMATQLRSQAARAKQMSQRVDLNQRIKGIESAIDQNKQLMLRSDP